MADMYRIRVRGHLDPSWSSWLGELTITNGPGAVTELIGPVVDQPALHGLLERIRDLGLTLITVERADPDA